MCRRWSLRKRLWRYSDIIEGIVNVLKPPGMTSSNVVSELRHIFNMKRVGHAGTLDPGAAGVLPVCLGRATRLFDMLIDKRKQYRAELCIGSSTDTQDAYGVVTETGARRVEREEIERILPRFTGEIEQIAPMYSAVRVDGRQMYKIARSGVHIEESERKRRRAEIYALELTAQTGENRFLLEVTCGRGTYVRTLCCDIGAALGVPAHMGFLLRECAGSFTLDGAYTLDELRQLKEEDGLDTAVISMEQALSQLGAARFNGLSASNARKLVNGATLPQTVTGELPCGAPLRIYVEDEFIGVGTPDGEGLHISLFLRGEEVHGE